MEVLLYLDSVLIPLSLFLIIGYHVILWLSFNKKLLLASVGVHALRRKGDDKKEMLAVQSLRNTLMTTIFTASITILITMALAAMISNAYTASNKFKGAISGSESGRIFPLKYGSACLFLLASFLCSSMALGFLTDANFLVNASDEFSSSSSSSSGAAAAAPPAYTESFFERGFMLALMGNRLLRTSFPLLLWMFDPLPVALASVALVWGLYQLDFAGNFTTTESTALIQS